VGRFILYGGVAASTTLICGGSGIDSGSHRSQRCRKTSPVDANHGFGRGRGEVKLPDKRQDRRPQPTARERPRSYVPGLELGNELSVRENVEVRELAAELGRLDPATKRVDHALALMGLTGSVDCESGTYPWRLAASRDCSVARS